VLAVMLRSTYEDGSAMSRKDLGDELLTLLVQRARPVIDMVGRHVHAAVFNLDEWVIPRG